MSLDFQHPLIVADIGGTNCRIGLIETAGATPRPLGRIDTQGADELHDAIAALTKSAGAAPRSALLAVAGPVTGARMAITNAGRMLDAPALAAALDLRAVMLVNDFEAQAAALAALRDEDLATIKSGDPEPGGTKLAIGPGTGFGAGLLIDGGDARFVVPSEGGHAGLGPEEQDERRLWPHLERVEGRVTIESVLSGQGLARLHDALARVDGRDAPAAEPATIVARALARDDAASQNAVELFLRLLARVAADLALMAKATGGVVIAGGVAPRLLPLLDRADFAARFINRPPMREMLQSVPVHLITAETPAFAGLGALANPAARVRVARPAIWRA